jgi:N-[(2S)-2-amino-2-carboxyethyl]-L-glutamate dehydrogenase
MTVQPGVPSFAVISGAQVHQALDGRHKDVVGVVESAYHAHGAGDTVNPPSYFLRFPDRPSARIIALPASVGGTVGTDGLKWIASFPENVEQGLPRASAVLILNDPRTGYPFACLESSIISAARTAASAALAADWLTRTRPRPVRVGFVGTGLIARYIHEYLAGTGWAFERIGMHDLSAKHAEGFSDYLRRSDSSAEITVHASAEELIRSSDLVVFATVAAQPHVHDVSWFGHNPIVLNVSLRDLSPEVVLASTNIVDDVEHCLKANTSVHLTEQQTGNRDFLDGTLHDVMTGRTVLGDDQPVVFSPFGLGVLDLALGKFVHDQVAGEGGLAVVPDFFFDLSRHGRPDDGRGQ